MASLKRFADTTEEEIEVKRININAKNTVKANGKCSRILRAYLVEKCQPADFESFGEAELSEALSHFYVDARKPDGEQYKAASLEAIRHGLNRYLKAPPHNKTFDIIKDPAFNEANKNFKAAMVELRKAGLGDTTHHLPIGENDRAKLYSSPHMSTKTPTGLLNKVQFDVRLYLCRRRAENMRSMTKSTFVVDTDPKTGLKFVTKKHQGLHGEKESACVMPESPGSPFCPVASFEAYLAKLHPGCDSLWQRPFVKFLNEDPVWYYNVAVGEKMLSSFMTRLSVAAELSKVYSNHSIRTTGSVILSKAVFGADQVITVTGLKPVQALTVYQKVDRIIIQGIIEHQSSIAKVDNDNTSKMANTLRTSLSSDHLQLSQVTQQDVALPEYTTTEAATTNRHSSFNQHIADGKPTVENPDPVSDNPYDHLVPVPDLAREPAQEMETTSMKQDENEIQSGILSKFDILALAAGNRKVSVKDESLELSDSAKKPDMMAEIDRLREEIARVCLEKEDLQRAVEYLQHELRAKEETKVHYFRFSTLQLKDFEYYTGYLYESFLELSKFLIPSDEAPFQHSKPLNCLSELTFQDQLLLVLMKLRQDFDFRHLATLFGTSSQDCCGVFSDWMNYMFYKFGSVPTSIWPHRDTIIENMPTEFKQDFPNTLSIIDVTEVKIQRPQTVRTESQSQFYSDKTCTTLKGIIGVDPRGAITFVSMLHYSSMSNKDLVKLCGFYRILKQLLQSGVMKEGDGIMAGKDFPIEKEIQNLGLELNVPPIAPSSTSEMSASDVTQMNKIAKHHVHVEQAIARIKEFKILSSKSSLGLFKSVNQIWRVCCLLTNFMPFLTNKD
ncbi:uncharacterized protein LOC135476498 [Liolophura sinensis]|uniref:uncharacterized protein LOC135476498 n=1 Tax=Liolophura sinensis TaxID=3198878 RepID=UPI003159822E